MKRLLLGVAALLAATGSLFAQTDPLQKLNIPDKRGWDKPQRFTITDRVWPGAHGEADVCMYENDAMGAVCFSVDDDYVGEHEYWLAIMDKYGWTLTWFLIVAYVHDGGSGFHGDWDTWRNIATTRHQVQSHTWSHGHCADLTSGYSTLGCPTGDCCDVDFEYMEPQRLIRQEIPGNRCWTQAYSGHNESASYYHQPDTAAKYYIGCRGVGGRPNLANRTYYMNTNAGDASKTWIDHLITKTTEPLYWRGWIADFWHSHGDTVALRQKFDYVKQQEDAGNIWVGTFEELLKYTQSWVTRELTVDEVTSDAVTFTLSDSMRDTIYTYPLTVKVRVNNDWDTVYAVQNGNAAEAEIMEHEGNKYVFVKAVPDGGSVTISKQQTTYLVDEVSLNPVAQESGTLFDCTGKVINGRSNQGMYLRYDPVNNTIRKIMVVE